MKRIAMLVLVLALVLLTGCGPLVEETELKKEYRVYATFYPVYALSGLIIGENIPDMRLYQLIQPQDGCLRSYSLSDWDAYIAMNADCIILNGSGLEAFEGVLRAMGEDGPAVISATGSMALLRNEEITDEESHFYGPNPWMFLSVDGACEMTRAICANMQTLDPAYEAVYANNLLEAEKRFETLKSDMDAILRTSDTGLPVAVAHEGLLWFADEWQLNCALVIDRESGVMPAESELREIVEEIQSAGVYAVLIEKQAPKALVRALEEAGCRVALMNTMSGGSAENGAEGYFEAMLQNAGIVKNALSKE